MGRRRRGNATGLNGFHAIRASMLVKGDALRDVLDEIVRQVNFNSPVANTMRKPILTTVKLPTRQQAEQTDPPFPRRLGTQRKS